MIDLNSYPSSEALFRYRVLSAVELLEYQGRRRSAAVREVSGQGHLFGTAIRQVSERTIWRWLAAHREGGVASLERAPRTSSVVSTVLPPEFLEFLRTERSVDRKASIPELIHRAKERGILHPNAAIDRTTIWRTMNRMGLDTRQQRPPQGPDTRRFAYPERMMMVLVDFKHFRAGERRAKRVAIYFLDDATRFGLGVVVATSERADVVLPALAEVLRQYGLMVLIYWDNGPGFIADDVAAVCEQLEVPAIFGTAGYAEGHGKIERFNRSLKARTLESFDRAPHVDPDCGALTLRLKHDLFQVYNHRPHESLKSDTPYNRWSTSERPLRSIPSDEWLVQKFTLKMDRTVSKDHVIRYGGGHYEVPRSCRPGSIQVYRRLLEGEDALYVEQDEELVRIHPVDPHFNATSGRARAPKEPETPPGAPQKSASMLAFEREHPSMLDADGGYADPSIKEDNHEQ